MREKPTIVETNIVSESKLFKIESVDLCFTNGETRKFERIHSHPKPAVIIVPWLDQQHLLMIREYAVGLDSYQLGFPKGLAEGNESLSKAANRELQEEAGFAARDMRKIKTIATAPGFMSSQITIFEAQGLYESRLEGDEPEPLEIEIIKRDELNQLLNRDDFLEARSIAALFLVLHKYRSE